ncbi:MAG: GTP-binding protein [Marinobacter sp.]
MSEYHRMAFVGDVGCGKTTIIQTLSDISTVNTDRESSVPIGKQFTTVGIDYGRIVLNDEMALGLYGVPGQRRFSVIWDQVNQSLWGLALLVRYAENADFDELFSALKYFDPVGNDTPFAIGVTHLDGVSDADADAFLDSVKNYLRDLNYPDMVLPVDCRDRNSAMLIPSFINSLHGAKTDRQAEQ